MSNHYIAEKIVRCETRSSGNFCIIGQNKLQGEYTLQDFYKLEKNEGSLVELIEQNNKFVRLRVLLKCSYKFKYDNEEPIEYKEGDIIEIGLDGLPKYLNNSLH